MRAPIWLIYGDCVYGQGPQDPWAAFHVETSSYAWLPVVEKQRRLAELMGALEAIEADVQILRVSRRIAIEPPTRHRAGQDALTRYLVAEAQHLQQAGASEPQLFMLVSLKPPERDVATFLSGAFERHPREWASGLKGLFARSDRRLLSGKELERNRVKADRIHERLAAYIPARPVRGAELQWLVRRAFCRGLREPEVEGLHEPRALIFERNGQALLAPLEGDLMRWMDCVLERRGRVLRVESELGVSWQAQLVLGALPESVRFPGFGAELMFAPVESLPFPVDLSLNARYLPNELALRVARRRIQDADQIVRAEAAGDQGASDLGLSRSAQARDLLSYLQSSRKPPLLKASLALALGAPDEQALEEQVEACRRAYGEIKLHRPLGGQLDLFWQHLPGQRSRLAGYDDTLTVEQVGAMMPTAAHIAGSRASRRHHRSRTAAPEATGASARRPAASADSGFHLGRTLTGSRRPVRFNLSEGSEQNRNTAILSVGALGAGKTTLDQKLKYEAFLLGAKVVDCDPKGDHRLHLLEEVAPHVESVTLRPDPALRGMLDPLRVAPEHLRQDATVSFLRDLLPQRADAAWETAIVAAVDAVRERAPTPTCLEVVRALLAGEPAEVSVGKALEVYARSGLTQLGFADPSLSLPAVGGAQVVYLPIRDLPGPEPGTPRSEQSQAERIGEQIVRLIAMFAMRLMASERERLKVFSLDNAL